ncbi:hypothetical protein D3C71_2054120 [compost metagenome]
MIAQAVVVDVVQSVLQHHFDKGTLTGLACAGQVAVDHDGNGRMPARLHAEIGNAGVLRIDQPSGAGLRIGGGF